MTFLSVGACLLLAGSARAQEIRIEASNLFLQNRPAAVQGYYSRQLFPKLPVEGELGTIDILVPRTYFDTFPPDGVEAHLKSVKREGKILISALTSGGILENQPRAIYAARLMSVLQSTSNTEGVFIERYQTPLEIWEILYQNGDKRKPADTLSVSLVTLILLDGEGTLVRYPAQSTNSGGAYGIMVAGTDERLRGWGTEIQGKSLIFACPKALPSKTLDMDSIKIWTLEEALSLAFSKRVNPTIPSHDTEDATEKKSQGINQEDRTLPVDILVPRPQRKSYVRNNDSIRRFVLWALTGAGMVAVCIWLIRIRRKKLEDAKRLALLKEKREKELF